MKEIWKDIKGYEGLYQVSNFGKIKSLPKKNGTKWQDEMYLKLKEYKGYLSVNLYRNKRMKSYQVHRVVASNFIPNIYNKPEINHKNGIKTDNRVENLEWCTRLENMKHARETGLISNNKQMLPRTKISQYTIDGHLVKIWIGVRTIQKELGFDYTSILHCCRGRYKTSHGYMWKYEK